MSIQGVPIQQIASYYKQKVSKPKPMSPSGSSNDFSKYKKATRQEILKDSAFTNFLKKVYSNSYMHSQLSTELKEIATYAKKTVPDLFKAPERVDPSIYQQFQRKPSGQSLLPTTTKKDSSLQQQQQLADFVGADYNKKTSILQGMAKWSSPLTYLKLIGMAIPRAYSATALKAAELQPETSSLNTWQKLGVQNNPKTLEDLYAGIPKVKDPESGYPNYMKEVFKAGGQGLINKTPYEDVSFKDVYSMDDPRGDINWEWAQDQNDWFRGSNWVQKILAGVAGSPNDIKGFATDVAVDWITYLSGGLGIGSKTGIRIGKAMAAKGGKTVLPGKSMLGLSRVGKAVRDEALEKQLPIALARIAQWSKNQ